MRKILVYSLFSLMTSSLLIAQSLVDVAKQEQERREKLKGKTVKVVTNADLKATVKKPAVGGGSAEVAKPMVQGQTGVSAQEPQAPAATESQPAETAKPPEYSPGFAEAVSPDTFLVDAPELALGPPDGRYAQVSITGFLDLDFEARNGPGDDIAIYAKPPAARVPEEEIDGQLEGLDSAMWYGDFRYAVLGLDNRGEWEAIGIGSGQNPDKFDLGNLSSIKKIRIMFKLFTNPYNLGVKPFRQGGQELVFGIDAVEALH
jgi:hypothetical protein